MKVIDATWEDIAQINCNCGCGDNIQIRRDKTYKNNNDEIYYVQFINCHERCFSHRLKTFFKYRKDWKQFIYGEDQLYNMTFFSLQQIEELYSIIYNDAVDNEIIVTEDIDIINKWKPSMEFEKYNWDKVGDWTDYLLFKSRDDLVLSMTVNNNNFINFGMSWAFYRNIKKKDVRQYTRRHLFNKKYKFMCQEYELFLYKEDLISFLGIINYITKNIEITNNGDILKI